jgi:hypothetical protein
LRKLLRTENFKIDPGEEAAFFQDGTLEDEIYRLQHELYQIEQAIATNFAQIGSPGSTPDDAAAAGGIAGGGPSVSQAPGALSFAPASRAGGASSGHGGSSRTFALKSTAKADADNSASSWLRSGH